MDMSMHGLDLLLDAAHVAESAEQLGFMFRSSATAHPLRT